MTDSSNEPDLAELVGLFHENHADLATFRPTDKLPSPYAELLDHGNHMTVTVERFHASPVDVDVQAERATTLSYAREILLRRQRDGVIVQHGIVHIDRASLPDEIWQKIEAHAAPLGRILIEHNVHRDVELCALWQVTTGPRLADWFSVPPGTVTFGRTALIHFQGQPALKLLEIVAPVDEVRG